MTIVRSNFSSPAQIASPPQRSAKRAQRSHKTSRDCPRVTVRLAPDDYEQLQELADGMALSTYLRAAALEKTLPRRKPRSKASVADREAMAQALGLLGQSRVANNLNQLAYQANIGALTVDDETRAQIDETYEHVLLIRSTLMTALGLKG